MAINTRKSVCALVPGIMCRVYQYRCQIMWNFNGSTKSGTLAYLLCVLVSLSVHWIMLKSFHRAANAIFGKVGRIASEEVTLQLIKSKCLPVLFYG